MLLRSFFMLVIHHIVQNFPPLIFWSIHFTTHSPTLHVHAPTRACTQLRPLRLHRGPVVWLLAVVVTAGLKIAPGTWQARRGALVSLGKVRSALVARRRGHRARGQSGNRGAQQLERQVELLPRSQWSEWWRARTDVMSCAASYDSSPPNESQLLSVSSRVKHSKRNCWSCLWQAKQLS